jgi:hypothetical protein
MKATVVRSGGIAAVVETLGTVDTARMSPAPAQKAKRLIENARFFDLPRNFFDDDGMHLLRFEVTVTDGARRHTVRVVEGNEGPLKDLIALVARECSTSRGLYSK